MGSCRHGGGHLQQGQWQQGRWEGSHEEEYNVSCKCCLLFYTGLNLSDQNIKFKINILTFNNLIVNFMLYYLKIDCSVVKLNILIFAKHFCQHSSLEGWNIFQVCDPADCQGHVIGDECQDKDHHPAHLSMWIHHSLKGKKLSEKSLCHFYQSANEICILKPTNLQNWWSSGTCCQHGWLPAWRRPPPTTTVESDFMRSTT